MMKKEKGYSLIEVVIAIALLGIVAIAFLSALATGSKAISIADERATAESLARAQMEYIRNQAYSDAPWDYTITSSDRQRTYADRPTWWSDDAGNEKPPFLYHDGYTVMVDVSILSGSAIDDGIQVIEVTVDHHGKQIFILEGYRAKRGI